jgi:putative iron-regulated protein
MRRLRNCIVTALGCGALWGCGGDDDGKRPSFPVETHEAIETYSAIVLASYTDSLAAAEDLKTAVEALVETPTEETFEEAQDAWRASRVPYLQTEVYRFYGGPIDNEEDGPEGLINAWPLDEQHIDYIEDQPDVGIVNDLDIDIEGEELEGRNESPGEKDISTGYHAIEFLLWGQDFNANGPGARPFTDYVVGDGGTAANQDRRGLYLTTVTDLLIGHLEDLVDAWEGAEDEDSGTYAAEFHDLSNAEAFTRILTGMTILSSFETGGERVAAALDEKNQEEEHSCFSDNTHVDMIEDVRGIQNVWLGRYDGLTTATTVEGTSIRDIVASANTALANEITDKIEVSLAAAEALVPPFDQEILEGNTAGNDRVRALAVALQDQGETIDRVFPLFGLQRPQDPE